MASSKAHHATGWAAGIIAAAVVMHPPAAASADMVSGVLALLAGVAGATAPDWLEVAWWTRARRLWITHRTLTHWGIGWAALLALSYHFLGRHPAAPVAFGFACGGIMHLLADWPNPLGVPWIAGRHSLRLWTSGHCDLIIVMAAWAAALFVIDDVWFHHAYGRMLLNALHLNDNARRPAVMKTNHTRNRFILFFAVLLAMLALDGCAGFFNRDAMRVSVAGIEPLEGQGLEMRFAVKLRVQNPNDAPIDFDGVALDLDLNGRAFASGVSDQRGTVPRFGETIVSVPVTVSAFSVARQAFGFANGDTVSKVSYAVRGRLAGGAFGGARFSDTGYVDLPGMGASGY